MKETDDEAFTVYGRTDYRDIEGARGRPADCRGLSQARHQPCCFRDECLNETLFSSLAEARKQITTWKEDYNNHRPHSSLGNITPNEFAMKMALEKQAA